jgi:pimeloyl-ACP methyl ester carboxylesterase
VSLAAVRVASAEAPPHALVMLHGIYGRGRNWQSIARAVVAARPDYSCWLVDLPHHGDSPAGQHGDTVSGLAADVAEWLAAEHINANAVLGHSYGGKVALAIADAMRDKPLQVWVIDSTPETKEPSGSAWGMLALVRRLPPRFSNRAEAVTAIVDGGYALGVAQWMASNLVRDDGGFVWALDFDAMERLLRDFFETDLWRVIESPAANHEIHIVKASESHAISQEAVRRIGAVNGNVHLHHLTGGHWIHAESPQAITALLVEHLPSGLT